MGWSTTADAATVACRDTYGTTVTYAPPAGAPASITAILDEAHESITLDAGGTPVTTTRPVLDVRLADLAVVPVRGGSVVSAGTTYEVTDVQIDGQGGARLYLVEA